MSGLNGSFGGVVPELSLRAGLGPPRSECAVGALAAWAGRLWAVAYVSHKSHTGVGTGLYEIDDDFRLTMRPESRVGTYANRHVHFPSNQLFLGPHVIDADRNVRTIEEMVDVRVCGTMTHLDDPDNKVYLLGMEGEFFECDVHSLSVGKIDDPTESLGVSSHEAAHFKAGYTGHGRVIVANSTYDENDWSGRRADGRLAEWDGQEWTILEHNPFVEVHGRGGFGGTIFATGWDRASAILKVFTDADKTWRTYRLPKASHTYDHMWQTEWPRIREVEHERFLMDCHGMFYELSPWAYGNRVWGIRPISTHLWVMGDFCAWRGLLVLGADNASPSNGENCLAGEPQAGMWMGKTDDLWSFGKPGGWGGPWWKHDVKAGEPSDPYLMTGFDKKCLHFSHEHDAPVSLAIEVDFLGDGSWQPYGRVEAPAGGYAYHVFESGFSAHWVRVAAGESCRATVQFAYT